MSFDYCFFRNKEETENVPTLGGCDSHFGAVGSTVAPKKGIDDFVIAIGSAFWARVGQDFLYLRRHRRPWRPAPFMGLKLEQD